jgi:hypothetical protein
LTGAILARISDTLRITVGQPATLTTLITSHERRESHPEVNAGHAFVAPFRDSITVNQITPACFAADVEALTGTIRDLRETSTFSEVFPTLSLALRFVVTHSLRAAFCERYASVRGIEVTNHLFLLCPANPAIPVATTLATFSVSLPQLVQHTVLLLLEVEPLSHFRIASGQSPVAFEWNALDPTTTMSVKYQLYRSAPKCHIWVGSERGDHATVRRVLARFDADYVRQ